MRGFIIALCVLLLTSCSIEKRFERKLKRAERKIETLTVRYPSLINKDTLHDTIQIAIPETKADTIFQAKGNDTVVVYKDNLRIKYIRTNDTIRLSGACAADTITKIVSIPYEKIIVQEQPFIDKVKNAGKFVFVLLLVLALAYIAIRVAWKFIKPI